MDHWGGHPELSCVIAFDGDKAVGIACGASASPGREWWREYLGPAPAKDLTSQGGGAPALPPTPPVYAVMLAELPLG
ncbi:hypothetical protein [Streptomyces sp. NPDC059455]|uniref:hypothetical protein n=1 Tax=Streptomyces sp. NPDC059455 TaxID=3346837 RepID=UPI00369E78F1